MCRIWRAVTSLWLAVTLLAVLALGCVLATIVPQGLMAEDYAGRYPRLLAHLVTGTGLSHYFTSWLFLVPGIAFSLNLLACTVRRFSREARKRAGRRHGPDLLHLGLLMLVVGSLVSFSRRQEGSIMLRVGDTVELPGSEILALRDFTEERYEDGRPKEWTSVVDVTRGGEPVMVGRAIRVNAPLRVGSLTIYQASYGSVPEVELRGDDGAVAVLAEGDAHRVGDLDVAFMAVESDGAAPSRALLRVTGASPGAGTSSGAGALVRVGPEGADVDGLLAVFRLAPAAGLEAVADPGFPVVLVGLVLVAAGSALTFARKLREAA